MEENELLANELLEGDLPEPEAERTYHFIDGRAKGAKSVSNVMGQAKTQYLTEAELKAAFEDDHILQETFQSWDNYLGYMNERQDLIDTGEYRPDWHKNQEIKAYDPIFVMPDGTRLPADEWTPDMGQPASIDDMPNAMGGGSNVEEDWRWEQWSEQAEMLEGIFQKYATGVNPHGDARGVTHYSEGNDGYTWNGTSWIKTWEPPEATKYLFQAAIAIGAGMIAGAGAATLFSSSTPGWMVGAVKGAVGSLVSQGAMGNGIDPQSLLQSVLLAGVGGLVGDLAEMDASIFTDATKLTGKADEVVTSLSEMLKIPYDEALQLAESVANGVIVGDDITSIVANAAGKYAQSEIMDALQQAYGDTVQVADWFKDGQSNIPVEALEPFVGGAINAAINGGADAEDALRMIWDYHQAGGDLDFILPPGVDLDGGSVFDWIDQQIPDVTVDWNAPEFSITYAEGLGEEEGFEEEEKDKVTVGVPGLPGLPGVGVPEIKCPTGEKWSSDLSKCVPDLPEIPEVKCPTGQKWSTDLSQCIPDLPEIPEVRCPTGERWSTDLSKCVPDIDLPEIPEVKCPTGERWSSDLSQCVPEVPDVVECVEGFQWDDVLKRCVEIPEVPDVVECMEGFQWDDLLGKCVEIPEVPDVVECVEGFRWSDVLKKCVEIGSEDDEVEDSESENVDLDGIDTPETASGSGGPTEDFESPAIGLFAYTTINKQQAAKLSPFVDYIKKAKGMLS